MKRESHIIFQPSGIRAVVPTDFSVLEAANSVGEGIEALCGGNGFCGKCRVRILDDGKGASPDSISCLNPVTEAERRYFSEAELAQGMRLACRATIVHPGQVTVFVPESSRRGRQVIHKGARDLPVEIDPAVAWYHVSVPASTLEKPEADVSRLLTELSRVYGLKGLSLDRPCLLRLPDVLHRSRGDVSALVWQKREVLDVIPGMGDRTFGVAIDIGTTTVAAYFTDLGTGEILATESMMNPQVSRGEDVMSRLSYVRSRETGLEDLHRTIVEGLNQLIESLCERVGTKADQVLDVVVVGNTAMHHLALGIDPRKLAVVPFPPAVSSPIDVKARDLGLRIHRSACVHALPIEAGFVGADNVAVLIAEQPYLRDELTLIIDIGTNGEIVFGNRQRLFSASCACGPAFEGAHIVHGMRAMPGAIEKVRIDPKSLEVTYRVIGHDGWFSRTHPCPSKIRGICGSGTIDAVAQMRGADLIDATGRLTTEPRVGILLSSSGQPEFMLVPGSQSTHGQPITITSGDVRAIQNAKSALRAGAVALIRRYGVDLPERIILAGAFGLHLDVESVLRIGMVPEIPPERIYAVGNSAGDGARLALLSTSKRREAERIAREVEYVELSSDPCFNEEYILSMMFP
jgi:uncharacterized 2Fe-2S/4Fe-4S cluster protein (DUF4445 family)